MTNKQRAFLTNYLGPCRYSATLAAETAGYKCRNRHSLQETGRQLLSHPEIKEQIEESFRLSNMSRKEVLTELTKLARGDSKDKLRALALMSAHHNLLNGQGSDEEIEERARQLADRKMEEYASEISQDVERFNQAALESNRKKDQAMREIQKLFDHNPEAVQALKLMRDVALEYKTIEQVREELTPRPAPEPEVEIIPLPPSRRLGAAPAERLLEPITPEIVEPEPPPPCGHGYNSSDCYICDHLAATQRAWFG